MLPCSARGATKVDSPCALPTTGHILARLRGTVKRHARAEPFAQVAQQLWGSSSSSGAACAVLH